MSSRKAEGDVRLVFFESSPKKGKAALQVVLQRKTGRWAITFEKGNTSGSPWLVVPIEQVPALSRAFVRAYQVINEVRTHGLADGLVFPVLLCALRRKTGKSSDTCKYKELRLCVQEWENWHFADLSMFKLEGDGWQPIPRQHITVGFADLEPVQASLERALTLVRNHGPGKHAGASRRSRFNEATGRSSGKGY